MPIKPERKTEPSASFFGETLAITMIKPAQQSMTIWTMFGMERRVTFPAFSQDGIKSGKEPKKTTARIPKANTITPFLALEE